MTSSTWLIVVVGASAAAAALMTLRLMRERRGGGGAFVGALERGFPDLAIVTFAASPRIRRFVLPACLVLAALVGLIAAWLCEPSHKGKPVSYWVDRACEGYDSAEAWEFRGEVKAIGPTAVNLLTRKLRPWDGARNTWRSLRSQLPVGWQPYIPDVMSVAAIEEQRYGAARTLALFGPQARPAVGSLIRLLPDTKEPLTGVIVLALEAVGPAASRALPALHSSLTNQDASLQVEIAGALWKIGQETNKVVEVCTNVLVSHVDSAVMNAGFLLSRLFAAAAPAAPLALQVLVDTNSSGAARANAAQVLGAARVSTTESRLALLDGIRAGPDLHLRCSCALALWRLDSHYAPLATRLLVEDIVTLKHHFPGNEQDLTEWLKARDLNYRESIPTLTELLSSDSPDIRKEAADALQTINVTAMTERNK